MEKAKKNCRKQEIHFESISDGLIISGSGHLATREFRQQRTRHQETTGAINTKRKINMGYWPSVRSRWLDIGQVLFFVFMDRDEVEVHKLA